VCVRAVGRVLLLVGSHEVASFKIGFCFQYEKRKIVVEKGKKEDRTQERRYKPRPPAPCTGCGITHSRANPEMTP
jgi:TPP-dependent indolepyruvate ferredoxin oxidoreductase alpha subunit